MSKQYTVQAPDGRTVTIEGPEGASEDEVIKQAQALYKPPQQLDNYQSPLYPKGPESRTPFQVASDQAANVLTGIPKAITGIPQSLAALPGMVSTAGNVAYESLKGNQKPLLEAVKSAAKGPLLSTLQGKPPLPESPEWAESAQNAGALLGSAELPNALGGAGKLMKPLLPSTERAGQTLNAIMAKAKNVQPDVSQVNNTTRRIKELEMAGSTPPAVARKFIASQQPTQFGPFKIAPNPLTYGPQANLPGTFDLASKAKSLSPQEFFSIGKTPMEGAVSRFAGALQDANRDAAASVGMGRAFDAAMKEYSQAKTVENALRIAKKAVMTAAIGGSAYYAGRSALRDIIAR